VGDATSLTYEKVSGSGDLSGYSAFMKMFMIPLVILVAVLHLWFLTLEMFLWRKPLGRKIFRITP
jgi:hypothetical protein